MLEVAAADLRPAQAQALRYSGGRMAISAAPGSGKTFILTQLVVHLVADLGVRADEILVLTYMRSAALTFRARTAAELARRNLSARGFLACTIHSFCQRVLRYDSERGAALDDTFSGGSEVFGGGEFSVMAEAEKFALLRRGLEQYLLVPAAADAFRKRSPDREAEDRKRDAIAAAAKAISAAKQARRPLDHLVSALGSAPEIGFMARFYREQQDALNLVDFDDLLVAAVDRLRAAPALLAHFRATFRYLLEDEAQDSTPVQNELLELLAGPDGNLVRVGDPNQAIMSSFTNSAPGLFRAFCDHTPPAAKIAMSESSRSAMPIIALANRLVEFASLHPDAQVSQAFAGDPIGPATAGPRNPDAATARLGWATYEGKDYELAGVVSEVRQHLRENPGDTCAILCVNNSMIRAADGGGYLSAARATGVEVFNDEDAQASRPPSLALLRHALALLQIGPPQSREAAVDRLLDLAEALAKSRGLALASRRKLAQAAGQLGLRCLVSPRGRLRPARPPEATETDYLLLVEAAEALERLLSLRHLPLGDLLVSAAAIMEPGNPEALLLASKIGSLARAGVAQAPGGQLRPAIRSAGATIRAASGLLAELEQTGRAAKLLADGGETKPPGPGQVVITTLHRSKGAEFDAVWIPNLGYGLGAGKSNFPWDLSEVRLFDEAAVLAERLARGEAGGDAGLLDYRREFAAERLRLLYVGITRARKRLSLSCYAFGRGPAAPAHVLALAGDCAR